MDGVVRVRSRRESGRPPLADLIGPGLIAGAADDDPSGIATYSQAGAQFGPHTAWSPLLAFPFMAGIQEISARIGRVTGKGIAGNLVSHYPLWLSRPLILLMLIANTCNLGADLGAMGSSLAMLIGGPEKAYASKSSFSRKKRRSSRCPWRGRAPMRWGKR